MRHGTRHGVRRVVAGARSALRVAAGAAVTTAVTAGVLAGCSTGDEVAQAPSSTAAAATPSPTEADTATPSPSGSPTASEAPTTTAAAPASPTTASPTTGTPTGTGPSTPTTTRRPLSSVTPSPSAAATRGADRAVRSARRDVADVAPQLESYYRDREYPVDLAQVQQTLAESGVTLSPGNRVAGYVYDGDAVEFVLCVENESGAWATYDTAPMSLQRSGRTGGCPT